jgi:cyclophilin family peptidyl-prolyl cis-trans isomerase
MRRRRFAAGLAVGGLAAPAVLRAQQGGGGAGERLILEIGDAQGRPKVGPVAIQLLPDVAPRHVERIRLLAVRNFYDGTPFHRVIEGFMAQGGDQTGTGTGGSGQTGLPDLAAEFTNRYRFVRGTCGMARSGNPNSANSQFFIMFAPAPSLDGQYTIWGRVVGGMETVDQIKRGDPARNGQVQQPDKVLRATVGPA